MNLDYDMLSHMIPININGPVYCCAEPNPSTWTHRGDPVGLIVHVPLIAITICGCPGWMQIPRRGGIENGCRRGDWPGSANVVRLRQGTTIDCSFVSASTAA